MNILVIHNAYQQKGGEDAVAAAEVRLLREHGHEVRLYARHNDELKHRSAASAAAGALWSSRTYSELRTAIAVFRPDVIHAHNTFPLVSPSAFWASGKSRIPVVQTLHNYRLLCPQAMFLRDGAACEDCIGHVPWRAVLRRCYRGSAAQSAVVSTMLVFHRTIGTYREKVSRFIALSEFARSKLIAGGIPGDRIVVKPNFVDDRGRPAAGERQGALFVGRLSAEKGASVLLGAFDALKCPLTMIGDGPDYASVAAREDIVAPGWQGAAEVRRQMERALFLVMPSLTYEGFPMTLAEAYAAGLPVIASRIGSLAELVREGETGLLFDAGSPQDLAKKMRWAFEHPGEMRAMGDAARRTYEARYTAEENYRQLMAIYGEAVERPAWAPGASRALRPL